MFLKRGEEREVKFILSEEDFSLVDRNLKRIVEPGTFQIMIGAASDDIRLQDESSYKIGDAIFDCLICFLNTFSVSEIPTH